MTNPTHDLVSVEIETHLGARYVFPDVPKDMVENVIRHGAWETADNVVLVNVSAASLAIPLRVVKIVRVNGEERWQRAAVSSL